MAVWKNILQRKSKFLFSLLAIVVGLVKGYSQPAPPPIKPFAGGPGNPTSSIEMYVVVLLLVAILGVTYYTLKKRERAEV